MRRRFARLTASVFGLCALGAAPGAAARTFYVLQSGADAWTVMDPFAAQEQGLRDIVVDGVTGLLVPPRSPHAVATAVRELIADPVQHGAFGVAGRDRAETRYSWGRAVVDLVGAYERAVRQSFAEPVTVRAGASRSGAL